jgi:hypothetical protein
MQAPLLHLMKLSVGTANYAELLAWQRQQFEQYGYNWHTTRMTPTRSQALLAGGSLYWVVRGHFIARQALLALEESRDKDGQRRCRLRLAGVLIPVEPQIQRPFQGWRYLSPAMAPADIGPQEQGPSANLSRFLHEYGFRSA